MIPGFRNIQLLRRSLKEEVEFIAIMWFDSLEAVKQFAGKDFEKAVVLEKVRSLLKQYDQTSQHYEVK